MSAKKKAARRARRKRGDDDDDDDAESLMGSRDRSTLRRCKDLEAMRDIILNKKFKRFVKSDPEPIDVNTYIMGPVSGGDNACQIRHRDTTKTCRRKTR